MKPLTLKLRGAIGIHDGLGLDEVSIDFTRFESGLVALVGPNGSGKTTILENLHPYLQLASRSGSLSNHFRLRDSFRDLTFELQGHVYRAHILNDAQTAKTEAYLYRDSQPLNDGKVNTYKVEIEKLLGSPELFFRSIFSSQNSESITSLTPGKRKELFMELLGLQRYERYAEFCKVKVDALENEIAGSRGKLEQIYSETSKRPIVEEELSTFESALASIDTTLKNLQAQIDTGSKLFMENERRVAEDSQKHTEIHDLGNEISVLEAGQWKLKHNFEIEKKQLEDQSKAIEAEIERKKKIVGHKTDIESNVMRLKVLRTQLKGLEERKSQLTEIEQAESKARFDYQQKTNERRNGLLALDNGAESFKKEIIDAQKSAELIKEVPCAAVAGLPEQCKLLSRAIAARDRIGSIEKRLEEIKLQRDSYSVLPNFDDTEFNSQKQSIGYDAGQHLQTKKEVGDLEKGNWESLVEELRLAESMIEEKQKALLDLKGRSEDHCIKHLQTLSESMKQSDAKRLKWEEMKTSLLTQEDLASFKTHKEKLAYTSYEQKQESERRARTIGDIQFRQEMIKKLDALKADSETIESDLAFKLSSLEHHKLLHRACSKDGIPALELDAAGPEVSRIANELLASTFGSRFQIAFETTRLTKDKKKQVETFEIRVYGEDGEKKIEDLSGGQRVWIETALQEAIAIYLSEKSGKELLTSYQDEKDGALDPDNKQHFVEMSREAFRLGRRYFTFLITQTPDIWQQVQQRLHLHPENGTIEQII